MAALRFKLLRMLSSTAGKRPTTVMDNSNMNRISIKQQQPSKKESHHDAVLERVLKLEREERQQLGKEAAFQAEIDHWLHMWTKSDSEVASRHEKQQQEPRSYSRQVDQEGWANGTGRRKSAVAQVWLKKGDGLSMMVKKEGDEEFRLMAGYFDRFQLSKAIEPLKVVNEVGNFNMNVVVYGGGLMGQAGAISLGIARALQAWDPNHRPLLKQAGLLTRDARVVERKKPGQKKARKKFQWVKR